MKVVPARWEVGSLFHLADFDPASTVEAPPWSEGAMTGCGRDALRLIADAGRHDRWWIPSYFCQEVVRSVIARGVELLSYPDSPLSIRLDLSKIDAAPGDAVLVMNYFGLRTESDVTVPEGFDAEIIEDHTHGPTSRWARESRADYCFTSLRKLYPLSDGGAVWSPKGHPIEAPVKTTTELECGALEKLTGMVLKRLYLEGHLLEKSVFRPILERGEARLVHSEVSAITALSAAALSVFPFARWEALQRSNFHALLAQLPQVNGFRILQPHDKTNSPFSALCVFDDEDHCTRARSALIQQRVYASRLWPLDEPLLAGVPDEHRTLAQRCFSIPIDMRYRSDDLERVGKLLRKALSG